MIIPALIDYYDLLEQDPESDIAPLGFSRQLISFDVVLSNGGAEADIRDARLPGDARPTLRSLIVPGQSKPSGSGINPCLLWDNAQYMLAFKPDDPKPERTIQAFEAFRDRHLALRDEIGDDAFAAVCRFLESWTPGRAAELGEKAEFLARFGVFRLAGEQGYVHERPAVVAWWRAQLDEADETGGEAIAVPSLATGRPAPVARLHEPKIKNVRDAQSSGATIVSFNQDAFESYGKSQGANSPLGVDEAFKYCTALNRLTGDNNRRVVIGDTTVVFWAESPSAFEDHFLGQLSDQAAGEDKGTLAETRTALEAIRRGKPVGDIDPETRFYILGLAPNAARLSVRIWEVATIREMAEKLAQNQEQLELGLWQRPRSLSVGSMLFAVARKKKGARDAETIPSRLSGELVRSILNGAPYPATFQESVLRRIRQEGAVTTTQARILKAALIRKGIHMPTQLETEYDSPAYQCGRLFATLEHAQRTASPEVSSGLGPRYLRAVMATPASLLGHLQAKAEVHIRKLRSAQDSTDAERFFHDEVSAINSRLSPPLPRYLYGDQQSEFMLGYYKQLRWLDTVISKGSDSSIRLDRYRTNRGEWVRSSLERRVLNTLHKCRILYVYESTRLLGDGVPRVPDVLINGATPERNVYIEVAGGSKDQAAYDERHNKKIKEYAQSSITEEGGACGVLRVLDFRGVDRTKKGWYDEKTMVIDKLIDVIPALTETTPSQETES